MNAPAGWGFRPNARIVLSLEDLPALPFLRLLTPKSRKQAVIEVLREHPDALRRATVPEVLAKWPALATRNEAAECMERARFPRFAKLRRRAA